MTVEHFSRAISDVCSGFEALRPPRRVTVSQGAEQNLVIQQPGNAGGPWSAAETPYMVEPMDTLASRRHEAVVMAKPARTGGTAGLLLGWLAHAVTNDPGDMLFIQMGREKAREFSKTDVDRAIRYSPKVQAMKSPRAIDSNTFDTMFRNGMFLRIAWPTVSNVSGSTYRYVCITDIDRIENAENVDGEGPLFDLARKRTTTFMSRGMTLVESSPGKPVTDPNWRPATRHEAPPVAGVLGIYNRSDRRRWYWQCLDCCEWFEAAPGLGLFRLPSDDELLQTIRTANIPTLAAEWGSRIICPHCGVLLAARHKTELNAKGVWLPDGVTIDADGNRFGEALSSTIAGFYLGGVAAAYQPWKSLIERHLQGLKDYALTGNEEVLKTTANTDQGIPYTSRHLIEARGERGTPAEKVEKDMERYICPDETRCVVAAVDVQGGVNSRFVVQVHAVGPFMEQWLVNRFEIRSSQRLGTGTEFAPIDPARYAEDWDVLTEQLLRATYRTSDPEREIRLRMLVVDSGGEDGATANAYAWYRKVRRMGLHTRVRLYKGASVRNAPLIKETLVGQRSSAEKGDITLLMGNPNLLSDAVDAGLKRSEPGPGYIHFPAWLGAPFFDELGAEVRNEEGTWSKIRKRNEAFDLCRMIRVGMLALGLDKLVDWTRVPTWLMPLAQNSDTISRDERRAMQANTAVAVEGSARPRRQRRVARSSYI